VWPSGVQIPNIKYQTSENMFKLVSDFKPAGDQPDAIAKLAKGLSAGSGPDRSSSNQTLLGVTGSGKTFTLANTIAKFDRPVMVLSHNKTLAAQLYSEFKAFFPHNAVEYFVSYYDYYLPARKICKLPSPEHEMR